MYVCIAEVGNSPSGWFAMVCIVCDASTYVEVGNHIRSCWIVDVCIMLRHLCDGVMHEGVADIVHVNVVSFTIMSCTFVSSYADSSRQPCGCFVNVTFIMDNLAKSLGTWDHPLLEGVYPPNPYPIEFVNVANWRTTAEKISILEDVGFKNVRCMQTLTAHPLYSDLKNETPVEGCDRGDYVAVIAEK